LSYVKQLESRVEELQEAIQKLSTDHSNALQKIIQLSESQIMLKAMNNYYREKYGEISHIEMGNIHRDICAMFDEDRKNKQIEINECGRKSK
jgi:ribosome recycling factor